MFNFTCNARLCFPCIVCRYSVAFIAFMYVNTQVRYQSACLLFGIRLVGRLVRRKRHQQPLVYTHLYLKTQTEMEYLIRSSSAGVCSLQRFENYEYRARERKCYN